jgi:hypothetical protein
MVSARAPAPPVLLVAIHTSAKRVGIGASAKSTSEVKPGKSPVRVSTWHQRIHHPLSVAKSTVDFTTFCVLRSLKSQGRKRELVIAKSHSYILGTADITSVLQRAKSRLRSPNMASTRSKSCPPSRSDLVNMP